MLGCLGCVITRPIKKKKLWKAKIHPYLLSQVLVPLRICKFPALLSSVLSSGASWAGLWPHWPHDITWSLRRWYGVKKLPSKKQAQGMGREGWGTWKGQPRNSGRELGKDPGRLSGRICAACSETLSLHLDRCPWVEPTIALNQCALVELSIKLFISLPHRWFLILLLKEFVSPDRLINTKM